MSRFGISISGAISRDKVWIISAAARTLSRDHSPCASKGMNSMKRISMPCSRPKRARGTVPLARFGREHGMEIRFIEFMPLDAQGLWSRDNVLAAAEIIQTLSREIAPLIEIPNRDMRAPATEYRYADGLGTVGFIASVSRPFCLNCNRIRLTSDGKLRYCLFAI